MAGSPNAGTSPQKVGDRGAHPSHLPLGALPEHASLCTVWASVAQSCPSRDRKLLEGSVMPAPSSALGLPPSGPMWGVLRAGLGGEERLGI